MKRRLGFADVVREETDETRIPLLVKMGREARDQFHLRVEIDFVRSDGLDTVKASSKALLHLGKNFRRLG
jgi:hypothetical protein